MRAKHTSQDFGQAIIFTYRHQCDFLTNNKNQKVFGATFFQHIALIGMTVSELRVLSEEAKKNLKKKLDMGLTVSPGTKNH